MASYLDPLISFVSANAWLGYLTLFLAALLEAVPVVGSEARRDENGHEESEQGDLHAAIIAR